MFDNDTLQGTADHTLPNNGINALVAAARDGDDAHIRDLLRCFSIYADTRLLLQLGRALQDLGGETGRPACSWVTHQ